MNNNKKHPGNYELENLSIDNIPEESFFLELRNEPVGTYQKFELNPHKAPESQPLLLKIIANLNQRLQPDSVLHLEPFKIFKKKLTTLRRECIELLIKNIPLNALNRFIIQYVEVMGALFRSADPSLKGHYHSDHAEGYIESLIKEGDGTSMLSWPIGRLL